MQINGAEIHYEETGSGREAIVFAHGLLCNTRLFDHQVEALKDRYRCICFDFRGQGKSEVTRNGYDIDNLTADAAGLIGALGVAPCHFVGLSMGGFVGMRLAARRPELIRSLVLMSTSADAEPRIKAVTYRALCVVARWLSMRLTAGPVKRIMFGNKFRTDPAREAERERWREILLNNDPIGATRAARAVFARPSIHDEIDKIGVPTLIIAGAEDRATTPDKSRRIHERIAGARLVMIPDSGHTVTVEEPATVNAALIQFFDDFHRKLTIDN
jgi:pimeloyl-ACP methyl ester carboxylesterase